MKDTVTLEVVSRKQNQKTPQEIEIERLASLSPGDLNGEDLRRLRSIRDARASLLAVEQELEEVKERKKLRVTALEDAIFQASMYFENRQMALNFGPHP